MKGTTVHSHTGSEGSVPLILTRMKGVTTKSLEEWTASQLSPPKGQSHRQLVPQARSTIFWTADDRKVQSHPPTLKAP